MWLDRGIAASKSLKMEFFSLIVSTTDDCVKAWRWNEAFADELVIINKGTSNLNVHGSRLLHKWCGPFILKRRLENLRPPIKVAKQFLLRVESNIWDKKFKCNYFIVDMRQKME